MIVRVLGFLPTLSRSRRNPSLGREGSSLFLPRVVAEGEDEADREDAEGEPLRSPSPPRRFGEAVARDSMPFSIFLIGSSVPAGHPIVTLDVEWRIVHMVLLVSPCSFL